jgi:hypothetical protein
MLVGSSYGTKSNLLLLLKATSMTQLDKKREAIASLFFKLFFSISLAVT